MVRKPNITTATDNMDMKTPQNTPASNAPISSRAQAPNVASIKEGKDDMDVKLLRPYAPC